MSELKRTSAQFQRFLVVSGISLAIDWSVYVLLAGHLSVDPSWAKRVSFAFILVWGFFAHKHYTFRNKAFNSSEPFRFGLLYLTGWALNSLVHDFTIKNGEASTAAFITATFVWACWNFCGQKFFVFRTKTRSGA